MRYDAKQTNNIYNLDYYVRTRTEGRFNIPALKPADSGVKNFQSFNMILSKPEYDKGVHFFISDYQFERIWREPARYIKILKNFPCVLTPDFSLYTDMPIALQVYNVYRSHLIGQIENAIFLAVSPAASMGRQAFGLEKSQKLLQSQSTQAKSKRTICQMCDGRTALSAGSIGRDSRRCRLSAAYAEDGLVLSITMNRVMQDILCHS